MIKVEVLGLGGCARCNALVHNLGRKGIPFSFTDVNGDNALADEVEALLDTEEYPIVILSDNTGVLYYIYSPDTVGGMGLSKASNGVPKIGCPSVDKIASNVEEIIGKY